MNKDEMINELKKDLVYNQYRDTYVIRGENLPFMAERIVKLFATPDVSESADFNNEDDCIKAVHRYRQYMRHEQLIVMEGMGIVYPIIDVGRMLIMCERHSR